MPFCRDCTGNCDACEHSSGRYRLAGLSCSKAAGTFRPVICIQERIFVSVLAFIVWPLALFLLLIAFGYCVQPPLDVPFGLIMFLIGLGLLICGIWMLLAGKNRRLYVFENGSLTYMTSWGRKRELLPGQRFSIRFGANDSIQFFKCGQKENFRDRTQYARRRQTGGLDRIQRDSA